jgi:hypothetical protein
MQLCLRVPKEGGWDTGVGRSSSIRINSRILIEDPVLGMAGRKSLAKK